MPCINKMLLQIIQVMNFYLVDLLVNFVTYLVDHLVKIWTVRCHKSGAVNAGVLRSRTLIVSIHEISCTTGSSC